MLGRKAREPYMSGRYQVRVFESVEKDGATAAGTILEPLSLTFSLYADSAEGADILLRKDVDKGKRSRGTVYQICPVKSQEFTRSIAAALDGSFQHVFLDPAGGPYSEIRRVRLPKPAADAAAADSLHAVSH